jgi:hypothetical protein
MSNDIGMSPPPLPSGGLYESLEQSVEWLAGETEAIGAAPVPVW